MQNSQLKPKFIAEISANHGGSFEKAKLLTEAAAKSGASYVKFQTFTADSMTLNLDKFKVSEGHALWSSKKLYDLYKLAATPYSWHKELFELARNLGIEPFSTPFDREAVDLLESLNCKIYKVASLEIIDIPLIQYIASTNKPIVISTGACDLSEVSDAVSAFRQISEQQITLLVCTSAYPAEPRDANLNRMKFLKDSFGTEVGLSDHTKGLEVSLAAVALGASLVERHIKYDENDNTLDSEFSLTYSQFQLLVKQANVVFDSLGSSSWSFSSSEAESRRLRRSLYLVKNVKKGDKADYNNVKAIRPSGGLPPKFLNSVVGRIFNSDFELGTPVSDEIFEK